MHRVGHDHCEDQWSSLVLKITYWEIFKYFLCHTLLIYYSIGTRILYKTHQPMTILFCLNYQASLCFKNQYPKNFLLHDTSQLSFRPNLSKHVISLKKKEKRILPLVKDQSQCFHPSNQAMLFAIVGFHLLLLKPTK